MKNNLFKYLCQSIDFTETEITFDFYDIVELAKYQNKGFFEITDEVYNLWHKRYKKIKYKYNDIIYLLVKPLGTNHVLLKFEE